MARHDGTPNLIQNQEGGLTSEKAKELGRKGGIASGLARRQRRQLRELLSDCMTSEVTDADLRERLIAAGYLPSYENAVTLAALNKAAMGDIEAARYVRDTLGEKPTETYNLSMESKPIQALDLTGYSDADLERLADRADGEPALLPGGSEEE